MEKSLKDVLAHAEPPSITPQSWYNPVNKEALFFASNTLNLRSRISDRNSTEPTEPAPDHLLTLRRTFQLIIHCERT